MGKIMDTQKKIEETVVTGYKAIENGVVSGYKAIETGVVSGYQAIEDKFVETFFPQPAAEPVRVSSDDKQA